MHCTGVIHWSGLQIRLPEILNALHATGGKNSGECNCEKNGGQNRKHNPNEWMTILTDFGAPEDECLNASIHSMEEAVGVSEEIRRFCKARGIDEKRTNYSALAVEELCLGIIKDRFDQDDKKHTIEIRLVHKDERILMSLKDNCKPFTPLDRANLVNPQDNSKKSISIRLFMGIVKETEYQMTLGTNVFTVTI